MISVSNGELFDFEILRDDSQEARAVHDIISKFEEFNFLAEEGDCVLVVKNKKKKSKPELLEKGEAKSVQISKISPKFVDILEQFSGHHFLFVLEICAADFAEDNLDFNQMKALMYFELRKITPEFKIGSAGANDWMRIIHGLGKDFNYSGSSCTDILADDFTWERQMGNYYNYLTAEADRS